ncbi:MAG: Methyltransferase protein [Marmoricola sp.]|nr:Methyltransferase protein [Marmoricola sp.]
MDLPLPPAPLRLMSDTDEHFTDASVQLAATCYRLGLEDEHEILDVGCGVGRLAIGLLASTDFRGRYVGFDVMAKQVRWARRTLSPIAPNFHFRHADVRNARYNPKGKVDPTEFEFPVRGGAFHFATLFSVFTHFYADDVQIYLHELRRVLRPGGTVVATWFLYDDDTLDAAIRTSAYPMTHRLDEFTIYNDAEDPLRAIAFHKRRVREMIAEAALELVLIEPGKWNGGPGPEFQDVVVLRRPDLTPDRRPVSRVRRALGRAYHGVGRRLASS